MEEWKDRVKRILRHVGLVVLVFVQGCSVIGYSLGAGMNRESGKQVEEVPNRDLQYIPIGRDVVCHLKNGESESGEFAGIRQVRERIAQGDSTGRSELLYLMRNGTLYPVETAELDHVVLLHEQVTARFLLTLLGAALDVVAIIYGSQLAFWLVVIS